jgi:hypothetical protein
VLWAGEEAGATSSPTPTPPRPSSSRLGQAAEQQTQDPSPARDSPVENERDARIRLPGQPTSEESDVSSTRCAQGPDTAAIFIPFSDQQVPENIWRPFRCLITESIFSKTCIRTSSGIDFTQTCMRFCVFISSKCRYFLISATGMLVSH